MTVAYRVFSHEMTVRSNWVDSDFAMINGAPTFMTVVDGLSRPHDVRLELPPGWKTSITGMPDAPGTGANHYLAPDFDTLVDSPIVAGNPTIHPFAMPQLIATTRRSTPPRSSSRAPPGSAW